MRLGSLKTWRSPQPMERRRLANNITPPQRNPKGSLKTQSRVLS
ncbi:hypothetical protein [Kingella oralis]